MKYNAPIGAADPNDPYIDGNPGAGIEGAAVPAAALEHPMREIVKVITEAGITPDAGDLTQLYQAIVAIASSNIIGDATTTAKGIVELATGAEALGGSDSTRAVTSAALASSLSLGTSGYMKLPGGLIIQWGKMSAISIDENWNALTFPVAFPTAVIHINPTLSYPSQLTGNTTLVVRSTTITTAGCHICADYSHAEGGTTDVLWFAMGY